MKAHLKSLPLFRDSQGRITIWQFPNGPIFGWFIFKIIAAVSNEHHIKNGSISVSMAFLFVWGYLELTSGVNYFRKVLGLIALIMLFAGYYK